MLAPELLGGTNVLGDARKEAGPLPLEVGKLKADIAELGKAVVDAKAPNMLRRGISLRFYAAGRTENPRVQLGLAAGAG